MTEHESLVRQLVAVREAFIALAKLRDEGIPQSEWPLAAILAYADLQVANRDLIGRLQEVRR